jgi:glutamate 5-kinase
MGLKSSQIKSRQGYKPYDEVIHRDNLVITIEA